MKRIATLLVFLIIAAILGGCSDSEPEGVVERIIEQGRRIDNQLYYWETHGDKTAVYRIMETTSDINCILHNLDGVNDLKSSADAVYMLRNNRDGFLSLTRLEGDRAMTTDAELPVDILASCPEPWAVSRNDVIAVAGVDRDGVNHLFTVTYERQEAERTFKKNEVLVPEISHEETEWFSTPDNIEAVNISSDGRSIALSLPIGDGSGKYGLYFIGDPGEDPQLIGEYPVVELGGYSSNGKYFLATFEIERRVDVFLINTDTNEAKAVTRVSSGFRAGHPSWHPNSRYFIYTTDFTSTFIQADTPLSGEQLYLYSLDSMNMRRLTAFEDTTMWVDFSPSGDFLFYASTPGVIARIGRGLPDEIGDENEVDSGLDTWRMSYVPWDPETFTTGNPKIMTPDETQFMVSWTVGGEETIGFIWGPDSDG